MNLGLAFSYVFKDKDWFKKVLFPALCGLIPVLGPFIINGWGLKIAKKVIDGYEDDTLPDLEFGADLGRGFSAALIALIYSLPVLFLGGISTALVFAAGTAAEDTVSIILIILSVCVGLLGLVLVVILIFMGAAGIANFVAKGKFSAAFKFKDVFGLVKKSFVSWLLLIVIQSLVMSIIAPLGGIVCFVGAVLTGTYASAINGHLLGQAYNKSVTPVLGEVEVL